MLFVGAAILLLSFITTGNLLIVILASLLFLPTLIGLQLLIFFIASKIRKFRPYRGIISLTPILFISLVILFKMSIWVQPRETFKLALGTAPPASVHNFQFYESAWTDYFLTFYCEISPQDLKRIIRKKHFWRNPFSTGTHSFASCEWLQPTPPPLKDYIRYEYKIPNPDGDDGICILYTTPEYNRILVEYSVD